MLVPVGHAQSSDEPENPILAHLQAIRRDQVAMLEQIQMLARQIARLAEAHVDVQQATVLRAMSSTCARVFSGVNDASMPMTLRWRPSLAKPTTIPA